MPRVLRCSTWWPQAQAGAAHVQALKTQRMKIAAEAGKAPAPHEENVLTHWVRSAADMRLKVLLPPHGCVPGLVDTLTAAPPAKMAVGLLVWLPQHRLLKLVGMRLWICRVALCHEHGEILSLR